MPTSETATKVDVQPSVGGGQDVESLITYTVVSGETTAASVAPGQSLLKKVTVEPSPALDPNNLNAADFPGQLSDLAALDSIQAELDRIQNNDGDNITTPASSTTTSTSTSANSQLTMTSNDGAAFLGSISDGSGVLTTGGGAQVVSVLQGDQIQEALSQQVQNVQTKRTLNSNSVKGQVVTKVIIAKNPGQTQQVTIPISSHNTTPAPQQIMMVGSHGLSSVSSPPIGIQSPTKTITLTHGGLHQSPAKFITVNQGSPSKIITGQKIAMSPGKSPTKITMIPVTGKSPQRIITSTGQILTMVQKSIFSAPSGITSTSTSSKPSTITMSPSKVILKQQAVTNQAGQKMTLVQQVNPSSKLQGIPLSSVANIQPVSVAGSKFQYVRLVTTPTSQSQTTQASAKQSNISSVTLQAKPVVSTANTQMKITVPTATATAPQVITRPAVQPSAQSQRIILPATSQVNIRPNSSSGTLTQIRPAGSTGATLTQLPPGTTIISGQNLPGVQGFALVPAQYVTQMGTIGQQLSTPQIGTTVQRQESSSNFVPIATSTNAQEQPRQNINGSLLQEPSGQRPRKPCNCTKSQCLKLYCDCFANGEFCHNCNCSNCANNLDHEEERSRAIKVCLDRNPLAFHPKIGKGRGERRHTKGCNCKRSGCLKNYCECYEAKILCTNICKCVGCKNFEESPDRKTLMHLADAAEVRVQQQTSAKAKLSSQIQDLPSRPPAPLSGERFAYTFVTNEVAEATCACLIAQAEEAERTRQMELTQERMILEEFGRCLVQVIESASRTKDPSL